MKKRRLWLFISLMSFALMISGETMVLAEDDASGDSKKSDEVMLEEIVITGSRIARAGFTSSSPLAVFDEQDITLAGNSSVDEFLKYVPQFTGYQMGKSTNNGSDQGQTKIDVRGLGFNRTLVLINGRRTIGDATYDGAVDINTIPEAMIKRVDVLTDGASSIYGSDAIAGVVNFVLNDDFEGLRITANYGAGMQEWDAENYGISILGGAGSDKGHIVYSMSWSKQKELLQGERDWAYDALYPLLQPDGTFEAVGSGSSNSRTIRVDDGPAAGSWTLDNGTARPFEPGDVYNYAPVNALTQPNERYQFATIGKIEIAENTQAYFEGMFTRRTSQQRLAPDASFNVGPIETPNNGTQDNDYVPADNPYNPFGSVNCSNDAGVCDIGVRVNRRFVESGGRLFAQKADQYRMVLGVKGELENLFHWDIAYTWAETQTADETINYGRFDRWAIAVDPVACAADDSCPGVLNPFSEYGGITPEQMAYLTTGSLKDLYNSSLKMIEINLNGEWFELDGGNIGWAAGAMHRRESGSYSPDEFVAGGLTTGGAGDPLNGAFAADEIYGEILAPILDVFSFDASFRWSDYDSVDSSKTTYKLGVDWEVFDGFRLRGTIGTGFRAPNIAELNDSGSGTFPLMSNPCEFGDRALAAGDISQTTYDNCVALGMDTTDAGELGFAWQSYQEYSAPSSPLKPENSDNFTFGFVWEDIEVLGGDLIVSADYWNVKVKDVIDVPGANALFNTCLASENLSSPACDVWDPLQYWGLVPGDVFTDYGNLGTLETDGVDISANFVTDFRGLEFKALADITYLMSYKSGDNLGKQVEQAGTADGFAVFPEWRVTTDFGLTGSFWSADLIFRWFSACDDLWRAPSTTADAKAESILYTDLVGTFTYSQNLHITAGINNLLDKDPPYFHSAFNANTEPGLYDVIGRRLFVSATWEF